MKNSIIDEIFFGNVSGDDIRPLDREKEIVVKIEKCKKNLSESFGEKHFEALDELMSIFFEYEAELSRHYFGEGVRLGLKLGVECLS